MSDHPQRKQAEQNEVHNQACYDLQIFLQNAQDAIHYLSAGW